MGAGSTLRGPLGRLQRLAGGVWGVFGDFGVVLGDFRDVFCDFGVSLGGFGPAKGSSGEGKMRENEACVEAFWRLLATFYAVLGELLEKT